MSEVAIDLQVLFFDFPGAATDDKNGGQMVFNT